MGGALINHEFTTNQPPINSHQCTSHGSFSCHHPLPPAQRPSVIPPRVAAATVAPPPRVAELVPRQRLWGVDDGVLTGAWWGWSMVNDRGLMLGMHFWWLEDGLIWLITDDRGLMLGMNQWWLMIANQWQLLMFMAVNQRENQWSMIGINDGCRMV